jgi:hypothetical protein
MPPKRTPQKSASEKKLEAASARTMRAQLAAKTANSGEIHTDGSMEAAKTAEEGSQIQPVAMQVCLFSAAPARDNYADPYMPRLLKFSNWEKLIKIVAYCRRMASRKKEDISPLEKLEAERALAFHNQRASFRATLFQLRNHGRVNHDNALASLDPFLDVQCIMRLAGRTEAAPVIYETKYPILLHPKDPVTEVLGRFLHRKLMHSGAARALHTELLKFYWVPRVTTLLRQVAYKCVVCRRKFAKPTHQMMAQLPFFRLPTARLHAFDHSAIDIAGPYNVVKDKMEGEGVDNNLPGKRWVLVIRCATVGAVHLEMIDSMDMASFLLAIERFLVV